MYDTTLINELPNLLDERIRRLKHENQYQPAETEGWNQLKLHKSTKDILLCFGGNQSGKSMFSANEILWWMRQKHPYKSTPKEPITVWVVSTEYVTIQNGVYRHIKNCIPDWELDPKEGKGPKVQGHDMHSYFKMKNGSTVRFMSAKGGDEVRQKFQADRVHVIAIDEEIPEVLWDEFRMRQVATSQSIIIISATLVMSEPWILNLEDQAEIGDPHIEITRLDTRKNPSVNQDKLNSIIATMDNETIKYRIEGKSRKFRGLVYSNFTDKNIVTPFAIPKNWPKYAALDPGLRTFAGLWVTVAPTGKKYAFNELYITPEGLYEVADAIRIIEGWEATGQFIRLDNGAKIRQWRPSIGARGTDIEATDSVDAYFPCQFRLIDDKLSSRTITGELGVLQVLDQIYGISCIPAIKDKQAGIERCRQSLNNEFFVFNTCTNFIKEIRGYRYRQDDSKFNQSSKRDEPIKKQDHLMDCWRYLMNSGLPFEEVQFSSYLDETKLNYNETFKRGTDWDILEWRRKKMLEKEESRSGSGGHTVVGIY